MNQETNNTLSMNQTTNFIPKTNYTSFINLNTNNDNISYVPLIITDEYLHGLSHHINTEYITMINSLSLLNYNYINHEIEIMSSQILEELNIIRYRENKNDILYNDIIILYNQSRQLFIIKRDSIIHK